MKMKKSAAKKYRRKVHLQRVLRAKLREAGTSWPPNMSLPAVARLLNPQIGGIASAYAWLETLVEEGAKATRAPKAKARRGRKKITSLAPSQS